MCLLCSLSVSGGGEDESNGGDVGRFAPFALISALASVWTIWEQKFHAGAIGAE